MRMLSVPPEVMAPHTLGAGPSDPPPSMAAHQMAMTNTMLSSMAVHHMAMTNTIMKKSFLSAHAYQNSFFQILCSSTSETL
jgi:hypothetical protein